MGRTFINLPVNHYDDLLSWDDATVTRLLGHARELAAKMGCRVGSDAYLSEAERRGGNVDRGRHLVLPTERQLDAVCDRLKTTSPCARRSERLRRGKTFEPLMVGNGANLLFDWETWSTKPPVARDLAWVAQWVQGYEDVATLYQPFMLKDMNLVLEPLYSYVVMCRNCRKTVYHAQPTEPEHVKYLDRMARIVEKHRGYYQPMAAFEYVNPPFRVSDRAVRTMLARIDLGVCKNVGIGPMTVSGMSAPVSVIGTAVTAVAEILAVLSFFHLLRPEPGLMCNVATGELDLATARVKYSGMRAHLQNMAAAEILRRGIGVEAPYLTWYRDANEPGLQACYEFGFQQAFFSGIHHHVHPEVGGLACGNLFSPEQAVMDIEIVKEYCELLHGFDAGDEMLGLDEIVRGEYEPGYHVSSEHTLHHLREHLSVSGFYLRGYPAAAYHDRSHTQTRQIMDAARDRTLAAHGKGSEAEPDVDLADELWECVREASVDLAVPVPGVPGSALT